MKVIVTLTALVGAACALVDNSQLCAAKDPSVTNAIGKFCQKTNLVVPSSYAAGGMNGYSSKTHIRIFNSAQGGCNPAQWVPQEYCFSQFYQMCVDAGPTGSMTRRFGRNGCQNWIIRNPY